MTSTSQKFSIEIKQAWVGLHLVLGVATAARFIHRLIPDPTLGKSINEILVAVVLALVSPGRILYAPLGR